MYSNSISNAAKVGFTMNTKQIQYALALSEALNVSQVADQLGISQPALSKQVLALEKELGVKLFDRSSSPMTLTPAGEDFVKQAQDLLFQQEQLLRSMEAYRSGKQGRLVIGISPFRSLYLVSDMVKQLQERHPGVQVVLRETTSEQLRKDAADGKYDFAIVNLPVDNSVLDVIPLEADTLVLAVPNSMLDRVRTQDGTVDLAQCAGLPFITVGTHQEMRQLFEKLCAMAGFHPQIAMEVVGLATAWAMVQAGLGVTLLPLQFISSATFDRDITLFPLKENVYTRQPAIVTRRGQYLPEYARHAIELLTKSKRE